MKNKIFNNYDQFVLRFPSFSLDYFFDFLNGDKNLIELFNTNKLFRDAILNAAPNFYYQLINQSKDLNNKEKFEISLYKYFARISSRSTPFGLFSAVTVGNVSNKSNFVIDTDKIEYKYNYNNLFIFNKIRKNIELKNEDFILYSNDTIIKNNNKYRYIEEKINEKGLKTFSLIQTDYNSILNIIYKNCKNGLLKSELINILNKKGYSSEESNNYIMELVNNYFLLTEIEFNQHESYIEKLNYFLKKSADNKNVYNQLKSYIEKLNIDSTNIIYNNINSTINPFNYSSTLISSKLSIDNEIFNKINNVIPFLLKMHNVYSTNDMVNFKNKFYDKYEFQKIPFLEALDEEKGISYPIKNNYLITNKFIDDLLIFKKDTSSNNILINNFLKKINYKIIKSIYNKDNKINLNDNDFPEKDFNYNIFPNTIYSMVKLFKENKKTKIILNGMSGPTAINLLSRFTSINSDINNLVSKIFDTEKKITESSAIKTIQAEIIFTPDLHVSNVISHFPIFEYYIPILNSKKKSKKSTPIHLSDLELFLDNERNLILWSKKLKCKVIPILTHAHNYSNSTLGIYKFLSELKGQNEIKFFGFFIGDLMKMYSHIPRIEYNDIVLFEERWFLDKKHIPSLKNDLNVEIKKLRDLYNLPKLVVLIKGDNELLINFDYDISIKVFIKEAEKLSVIELKEFIFNDSCLKDINNNHFAHEIIIPFYKNE